MELTFFYYYIIKIVLLTLSMVYKLEDGDFLEREFANQIRQHLPFYEKIWALYVGHQGNGRMADLPDYPYEDKRTDFAENSYTVLQSVLVLQSIMDSGKLSSPHNDINNIIEFHKNLVAFYALIGRINDCLTKAAECLGIHSIKADLQSFYDQRNVILHSRTLPLKIDDLGMPQVPDIRTWIDHGKEWSSAEGFKQGYVEDTTKETFESLIKKVDHEYARMYNVVCEELKSLKLKISVVHKQYFNFETSGSTQVYITASNSSATASQPFNLFEAKKKPK